MTQLDRYVGRIMLGAFAAALLFFLFLAVLVDILNNLPRYAERAARQGLGGPALAGALALYYLKLIPILFTTVTPIAMVIGGMFAVARLQHANEIVPMLFVGRSIRHVLRPMLWIATLAALAMGATWQWVLPRVGAGFATEEVFLREDSAVERFLVHETHGELSQYLYVREYDPINRTMRGIHMLAQGVLADDFGLTIAEHGEWDAERGDWRLRDGRLKLMRSSAPQDWLRRPDLTPQVLLQTSRDSIDPESLSYGDLYDLTLTRPNRPDVKYALHRHITYPLANLLLLLLALPLAVYYERGSRIERVLVAIALCGGYLLLDLTCQSLGQRNLVHPITAAWVPTIVFGSLGVVLYGSMRT